MTFCCLAPEWNSLLFCILYLHWVRILHFEVYLDIVLKWERTEMKRKKTIIQNIFLLRHYIWKNRISSVVWMKLLYIFRLKWILIGSKNYHVAFFIEMIPPVGKTQLYLISIPRTKTNVKWQKQKRDGEFGWLIGTTVLKWG